MKRWEVVKLIKRYGFKRWGAMRRYRGSSYQCFRKGNHYAWIGYYYLEIDTEVEAYPFPELSKEQVERFVKFACNLIALDKIGDKR